MKKKQSVNTFNALIDNKNYILDIRQEENKKSMPNCVIYSCMTFDVDMVPYNRFNLVYNRSERNYWAWTGDVIRSDDRTFRNAIADLFNDGILKLTV